MEDMNEAEKLLWEQLHKRLNVIEKKIDHMTDRWWKLFILVLSSGTLGGVIGSLKIFK